MNSKMLKNIGLIVLVVVIVGLAIYFYQQMSNKSEPDNEDDEDNYAEEVAMEDALSASEGFKNQHGQYGQYGQKGQEGQEGQKGQQGQQGQQGQHGHEGQHGQEGFTNVSEGYESSEPMGVASNDNNHTQLPSECYPKDVLNSADLLPRDANSQHAQVVPSGQGALADQNFLTAGYHVGVNTVGQSLRNSNRQLRSDPPNPQVAVSPWNQTTIEPDINRRPLEIGGH